MANILLLEPDNALANVYVKALEQAGHNIACCVAAEEALSVLDDFMPHVVVMELQLTGHNGIEFLHELRSYPDSQNIPVIVNTNLAPAALRPLLEVLDRDLGVRACLYKPRTTLQRLMRIIAEQARG